MCERGDDNKSPTFTIKNMQWHHKNQMKFNFRVEGTWTEWPCTRFDIVRMHSICMSLATTIFTACYYGYHRFNMTVLHSCQWILVCCLRTCSKPTNGKNSSKIVSFGRSIRTFESICFEYISTFDTNVTMVSVVFFVETNVTVWLSNHSPHTIVYIGLKNEDTSHAVEFGL